MSYDLYLEKCPFCNHTHLIRWGYYERQWLPSQEPIRVQRIRCTHCLRTTHVLPSFLLFRKSSQVLMLEKLVTVYINHEGDWKKSPEIVMDISTAYRWLRRFGDQVKASMPVLRAAFVEIDPLHRVRGPSEGQAGMCPDILFRRFLDLAEQLARSAVHLVEDNDDKKPDIYFFLNYFLWQKTTKPLLAR